MREDRRKKGNTKGPDPHLPKKGNTKGPDPHLQVGVVGNADEDDVRLSPAHLFAFPSRRALFLTGLGADPLPEMLDAPARLAVVVFAALVHEAAFARFALEGRQLDVLVRGHVKPDVQDLERVGLDDDLLRSGIGFLVR